MIKKKKKIEIAKSIFNTFQTRIEDNNYFLKENKNFINLVQQDIKDNFEDLIAKGLLIPVG